MNLFGLNIVRTQDLNSLTEANQDMRRALEDVGWIKINDRGEDSHQQTRDSYEQMVKRSRLAFIKNPIVAQAIHLTTRYTFGEGVSAPQTKSENTEVQDIVSEFWNDPDNKLSFTSSLAQEKISNKLQYDGELSICFKVDTDGAVYVRLVDPLSIQKIVYDTQDAIRPLFYKRRIGSKDQYIPDYANGLAFLRDAGDYAEEWEALLKRLEIRDQDVPKDTFLYHLKINNDALDSRGVPEVYRALDWMNANSKINSDMALFINTQAQFAWKKKFKGTKAQMQSARARTGQNTALTNPARMAGSVIFENEKVENEAIDLKPGSGQLFEIGIRRTLLMTIAAFGMMEHYFGDPSTGNLATATAMELPMLKKFQARQKLWEGVYLDVLNFQLNMRLLAVSDTYFEYNPMTNRLSPRKDRDYKDRFIDVNFPPILEKDLNSLAQALGTAKDKRLAPIETAQRTFLEGMGVNNIEEEMQKEFEEPAPAMTGFPSKEKVKESVTSAEQTARRLRAGNLAEKNKEVFRKMNGYLKVIAGEYRNLIENIESSTHARVSGDGDMEAVITDLAKHANRFKTGMKRAAERYLPEAARLGMAYVKARLPLSESHIKEAAVIDDFVDDQLLWNAGFLEGLAHDIEDRFSALTKTKYASKDAILKSVRDVAVALESRVGMYAGAFWTVEEKAVVFAGRVQDPQVNFVGVSDRSTCEDCARALEGNPWRMSDVPQPGEQICLSNCRHAIQIIGDEPLTESDVNLMRAEEEKSRAGYKLLETRSS